MNKTHVAKRPLSSYLRAFLRSALLALATGAAACMLVDIA